MKKKKSKLKKTTSFAIPVDALNSFPSVMLNGGQIGSAFSQIGSSVGSMIGAANPILGGAISIGSNLLGMGLGQIGAGIEKRQAMSVSNSNTTPYGNMNLKQGGKTNLGDYVFSSNLGTAKELEQATSKISGLHKSALVKYTGNTHEQGGITTDKNGKVISGGKTNNSSYNKTNQEPALELEDNEIMIDTNKLSQMNEVSFNTFNMLANKTMNKNERLRKMEGGGDSETKITPPKFSSLLFGAPSTSTLSVPNTNNTLRGVGFNIPQEENNYQIPDVVEPSTKPFDLILPQTNRFSTPDSNTQGASNDKFSLLTPGDYIQMGAQLTPALFNLGRGIFEKPATNPLNPGMSMAKRKFGQMTVDDASQQSKINESFTTARRQVLESARSPQQAQALLSNLAAAEAQTKAQTSAQNAAQMNNILAQQANVYVQEGQDYLRKDAMDQANKQMKNNLIGKGVEQIGVSAGTLGRGINQNIKNKMDIEMMNAIFPHFGIDAKALSEGRMEDAISFKRGQTEPSTTTTPDDATESNNPPRFQLPRLGSLLAPRKAIKQVVKQAEQIGLNPQAAIQQAAPIIKEGIQQATALLDNITTQNLTQLIPDISDFNVPEPDETNNPEALKKQKITELKNSGKYNLDNSEWYKFESQNLDPTKLEYEINKYLEQRNNPQTNKKKRK